MKLAIALTSRVQPSILKAKSEKIANLIIVLDACLSPAQSSNFYSNRGDACAQVCYNSFVPAHGSL